MDRRQFLAALALAATPARAVQRPRPGPLCFFSKHLPRLSPREMARRLRAAGFDGIELTVRPGGHVAPEAVEKALPKAIEDIRAEGLAVPIIATALTSAKDPTAAAILATAGRLGVPLFRPGWFSYGTNDVRGELRQASEALADLVELGRRSSIALAYQNHVGQLGAGLWDLDALVAPLDPRWAGAYFDIRHAVAEGSGGSWRPALVLLVPRVKVFSVKDFFWQRDPKAGWIAKDCPLGEGMVDLRAPLALLARHGFAGPVTVFLEYETKGGEDGVVAAAAKDLKLLRARIAEAYA